MTGLMRLRLFLRVSTVETEKYVILSYKPSSIKIYVTVSLYRRLGKYMRLNNKLKELMLSSYDNRGKE